MTLTFFFSFLMQIIQKNLLINLLVYDMKKKLENLLSIRFATFCANL